MPGTVSLFVSLLAASGLATAQTLGKTREVHPKLTTWKCTKRNGCEKLKTSIVLDHLSHPIRQANNPSFNCGDFGSPANKTACPDEATCAKNCVLDGISDYSQYGVTTKGDTLLLQQLNAAGNTVSPRVYLLDESDERYEMLKLTGKEFSFDVDVSKLPCGMNGALYLSEMERDGGKGKLNKVGAKYGTGYCDAQCFTLPFINGVGNIQGKGSCCNEMDIWEANSRAQSIAPHTCNQTSLYQCTGDECKFDGVCDQWGCAYNTYKLGNKDYYGRGFKNGVDTTKPFTVVTQFPAEKGKLKEIRRLYIQDGKVIQNAGVNIPGTSLPNVNYLNDEYCSKNGAARYMDLGATEGMGAALSRGMVLVFSVWWDAGGNMQWLDGGEGGPCNATEGNPDFIKKIQPDTAVTFSKVKWGEIDSTYTKKN